MPPSASTHRRRKRKQHPVGRQCGLYTVIYADRTKEEEEEESAMI